MKNRFNHIIPKCLELFEAFLFLGFCLLSCTLPTIEVKAQTVADSPTPFAHSHNDYAKKKPLWGALENGCTSIEIDVFAHQGELIVSHINLGLNRKPSLNELYLKPLFDYLKDQEWIFEGLPLILMIDFKTSEQETLPLLLEEIKDYKHLFTHVSNNQFVAKPLQLVISGRGFSYNAVKNNERIYVFLDGSVHHCNHDFPEILVERSSARYHSIFSWKGKKTIPKDDQEKLNELVALAKRCGHTLRFYAMPEKEKIWREFLDAGVHWINVDHPKKFRMFLKKYQKEKVSQ